MKTQNKAKSCAHKMMSLQMVQWMMEINNTTTSVKFTSLAHYGTHSIGVCGDGDTGNQSK